MATHLFSVRRALVGTGLSIALNLTAGCHKDAAAPTGLDTRTEVLSVTGGDAQSGVVGALLQSPLTIRVTAPNGDPVGLITVSWAVTAGGGTLSSDTSITNDSGYAKVTLTLGDTVGVNTVLASLGSGQSASLRATGIAGPVASLVKVQGDQQVMPDGSVSAPFVVRAVDSFGNPVAGVTVVWSADNGTPLAPSAVTDANGLAQDLLQALATDATYDFTADVPGLPPVTFTATSVTSPSANVGGN